MILSDFLTLEIYFATPESAQFFENVSEKYGTIPLQKAIHAGDLIARKIHIGPDTGRTALWLSEKGRIRAEQTSQC